MRAWIVAFLRNPMVLVVCRGSVGGAIIIIWFCPPNMRKASMTTLPFTDCTGSTTTATARGLSCSKLVCVFMSTPESQQPKPG